MTCVLRKIVLSCFRNYDFVEIDFLPTLNGITGNNGTGKTNLLEAIFILSTGKSFRTHHLSDLIQYGKGQYTIKAYFQKEEIYHSLTLSFSKEGRKILHNDTIYHSFIPLLGLIPSVFLSPEDIVILTGGPMERRRFIDLHIAQADPFYIHHLGRYQRALKQRNLLLKTHQKGLSAWEELMAISASYLIEKRLLFVADLQKTSEKFLFHLSSYQEPLQMRYISTLLPPIEDYPKRWYEMRNKESIFGTTLIGPHRDDILFSIHDKEVKNYASEGQKRCFLAALRLAQWESLKNHLSSPPLFGMDDFGIHLDKKRSSLLWELLQTMGQTFITAPTLPEITLSLEKK